MSKGIVGYSGLRKAELEKLCSVNKPVKRVKRIFEFVCHVFYSDIKTDCYYKYAFKRKSALEDVSRVKRAIASACRLPKSSGLTCNVKIQHLNSNQYKVRLEGVPDALTTSLDSLSQMGEVTPFVARYTKKMSL